MMMIISISTLIQKRFDEALDMLIFQVLHCTEYQIRKKYLIFSVTTYCHVRICLIFHSLLYYVLLINC
jgi:hypothetical protein